MNNRPGLRALAYRAGTHASFLASMRRRLSAAELTGLSGLTTRDTSDPSVAILDAWAAVGDVLTFYQERIANEGYLRTATERRSVLEQARLVGYVPRPGVAASVYLAYTIDKDAYPVTIPAGSRVSSIPGPGEQMQSFETSDVLEAREEWSAMGLRMSQPQTASSIARQGLYLKGTATNLQQNDALLVDFASGDGPEPFRVSFVEPDDARDRTHVGLRGWDEGASGLGLLRSAISYFGDVERFHVSADKAMTKRVLSLLADLEQRLAAGSDADVANLLQDTVLPELDAELALARTNNYPRLAPWLEAVIGEVSRAARLVSADVDRAGRAAASRTAASRTAETGGIGALIERLQVPASIPPRNSRQLGRSASGTFAAGSDIYPSLLSSLAPRLSDALYPALAHARVVPASGITVHALRRAAPLFGHNAPREPQYETEAGNPLPQPWDEWVLAGDEEADLAFLDTTYDRVLADTPVIVQRPSRADPSSLTTVVTTIKTAVAGSRAAYGMAAKTTVLRFADAWWQPERSEEGAPLDGFDVVRGSTVYCQSEVLQTADEPIDSDLCGGEVELDRLYDGLRSGRWMVVSGERTDVSGTTAVHASELVMLAGVRQGTKAVGDDGERAAAAQPLAGDSLHTHLTFAKDLAYCYQRDSVVLHGNVVHATHGETRREVLGGGDATASMQTFVLRQPPLTFTSAPTASGAASSLEVRVGGVRWQEADNLLGLGPASRGYASRVDDEHKTSVVFGNAAHGVRLPTGFDNVEATYRNGIGDPGNVRSEQISLLASKPLGVKAVVNPIRASGGADAETRDQARRNAPLAVMALDRLVGIGDYADFTRTFAGIGKAASVRLTDGTREVIHVTIAGANDIPIDVTSDLYANVRTALHRYGDPYLPIQVGLRELLALVISANVKVQPDYAWDLVEPAVRAALLDAFGFERRELGQDVVPSEVIATVQAVPGVEYVDLDVLRTISEADLVDQLDGDQSGDGDSEDAGASAQTAQPARVRVAPARMDGRIRPSQLAYLQPTVADTLILNEVTP